MLVGSVFTALWSGCGTSSNAAPDAAPSDGAATSCVLEQPLTCSNLTICTNYTVMVFHTALPTPAGGEIRVGAYRLSYVIYPPGMGNDVATEPADDEIAFGVSDFARVSHDASTAGIGTYTHSGAGLSFSYSQSCATSAPPILPSIDCRRIDASSTPPASASAKYTATSQSISIFRDAPGGFPAVYVYTAIVTPDGIVGAACSGNTSDPSSPGESQRCRAADICVCEHREDLAVDCRSSSSR